MADTPYKIIRDKLLTQLQTLDKIQDVYGYPRFDFTGYPAAKI